jgi:hypothetical protein
MISRKAGNRTAFARMNRSHSRRRARGPFAGGGGGGVEKRLVPKGADARESRPLARLFLYQHVVCILRSPVGRSTDGQMFLPPMASARLRVRPLSCQRSPRRRTESARDGGKRRGAFLRNRLLLLALIPDDEGHGRHLVASARRRETRARKRSGGRRAACDLRGEQRFKARTKEMPRWVDERLTKTRSLSRMCWAQERPRARENVPRVAAPAARRGQPARRAPRPALVAD